MPYSRHSTQYQAMGKPQPNEAMSHASKGGMAYGQARAKVSGYGFGKKRTKKAGSHNPGHGGGY